MIILPILKYLFPDGVNRVDWVVRNDSDGNGDYIWQWNRPEPQPTEAELAAAEPAALLAKAKADLSRYADEKALRHGATMVDPNSATNEPISDATAPIDEIRQQQGKARAKMHWGKRNGDAVGGPTVPGSQARNNLAQTKEEDLADEVVNIQIDIEAGTVTTEAEVDARITAIDMTY